MSDLATLVVRFESPAHDALRRPESLHAFIGALRARPGEWALLGQYGTAGTMRQAAYEVRQGLNLAFAGGGFEAQSRTMFGEHRVYVRFVGGGAS